MADIPNVHHQCHICGEKDVSVLRDFEDLALVTSDCRPWKRGGKLGVCQSCCFVQKITDAAFRKDCEEIYGTYSVYYQADGEEQRVFEQSRGLSCSRSESILIQLQGKEAIPVEGKMLDMGCGNGNLLKSFSKYCPSWILSGLEFDEANREQIEQIEHVQAFYSCELTDVPGRFDLISMIHCLEHIMDPVAFLLKVREKLNRQGLLLIEIPTYTQNPFDLIIADHCTHFDMRSITHLLKSCGFEPIIQLTDCVPKEITVLARVMEGMEKWALTGEETFLQERLSETIAWLRENLAVASRVAQRGPLGIFGTSIAGTWMYNEMPHQISFFVDEDPNRINKLFLNRKVYHPKDIPADGQVFIPLPHEIAREISARMKLKGRFFIPPPF